MSEQVKAKTMHGVFELLGKEILKANISNEEKSRFIQKVYRLSTEKLNIMVVGATGAGKSSTINAIFNTELMVNDQEAAEYEEVANVGVGVAPETAEIDRYEMGNLILWDTPGIGDGKVDEEYKRAILEKLNEMDEEGNPLIDLVLVVLDASSKDLGSSYELINEVILPALGEEQNRIIVGINQADIAMRGGNHWDYAENRPDEQLDEYLNQMVESVKQRIFEATSVTVQPVYYCAGYKEEGKPQNRPYNLTKLLYCIVQNIPVQKRLSLVDNLNPDGEAWQADDGEQNYKKDLFTCIAEGIADVSEAGAQFGKEILGWPGMVVGRVLGTVMGFFSGAISTFFQ